MPHVTIEFSANVAERTDIAALVAAVHDAAIATGFVPADGLRTRAVSRAIYAVGDRHPDNGFVAVFTRLAVGRTPEQRAYFMERIDAAVHSALGEAVHRLAISVEYIEIQTDFRVNTNHIRRVTQA